LNELCGYEEEYDEEGNPIDPCETEYQTYRGDGMDLDLNCLEYMIQRDCCYCFGNPNVVDEWCSFVCSVRGPCREMAKLTEEGE